MPLACVIAFATWLPIARLAKAGDRAVPQVTLLALVQVMATPMDGAWLPLWQTPYSMQSFGAGDLAQSRALDATQYMNGHLAGISLNATQNNPLQSNLQYRGFTASPLLGIAEGLLVYVDGVRSNEMFATPSTGI
jgi:hypothetical protein